MKFLKKLLVVSMVFILTLVTFTGCSTKKNEEKQVISTDGSTSMEKVIGTLGEAFEKENENVTFTYNPTGSGSGIQAVLEGRCDIGLSSRNLKDEEKAKGLKETILALDGIAVIVNPKNSISNLDKETIAKIHDGEIVVIGREAGSGTRDGFESIVNVEEKCKYRQELTSTGDVITTVSSNPNAIGYASLASLQDSVKTLSIEGVVPSNETIKDGSYIIQRPFILITKTDGQLSSIAQKFFDFVFSDEAAQLIESAGAVTQKK